MPPFMPRWMPLRRAAFTICAVSPTSMPPAKASLGMECQPPMAMALPPYWSILPPLRIGAMRGCCLNFWSMKCASTKGSFVSRLTT